MTIATLCYCYYITCLSKKGASVFVALISSFLVPILIFMFYVSPLTLTSQVNYGSKQGAHFLLNLSFSYNSFVFFAVLVRLHSK